MRDILDASAAKPPFISFKAPYIFGRDFRANFPLKWMHKDVGLMLDSGQELKVPLPATSLVHQLFGASVARGHGTRISARWSVCWRTGQESRSRPRNPRNRRIPRIVEKLASSRSFPYNVRRPGGNSHQSETNLNQRPLKRKPPRLLFPSPFLPRISSP